MERDWIWYLTAFLLFPFYALICMHLFPDLTLKDLIFKEESTLANIKKIASRP